MFAHLQVHMQMENHYSSAYKGAAYKEVHIYGIFQQRSNRSSDSRYRSGRWSWYLGSHQPAGGLRQRQPWCRCFPVCSVKQKLSERRFRPGGESCLLHSQVQAISAAGYFLRSPAGAHVGSMAQNRSLESHRLIGRTSYRRTNLWRFLLQLHRHCLFSPSCSCFCPGWRSCSACLRKEGGGSCRVSLNRSQIGSRA